MHGIGSLETRAIRLASQLAWLLLLAQRSCKVLVCCTRVRLTPAAVLMEYTIRVRAQGCALDCMSLFRHKQHIRSALKRSRGPGVQALCNMVSTLTGLRVLDLDGNNHNGGDIARLERPLAALTNLHELGVPLVVLSARRAGATASLAQMLAALSALHTVRPLRLSDMVKRIQRRAAARNGDATWL